MVSHKTDYRNFQFHDAIDYLPGMGAPIDIVAHKNYLLRIKSQYIFKQPVQQADLSVYIPNEPIVFHDQ